MTIEEYQKNFLNYPEPVSKAKWVQDYSNMITHTQEGHSQRLIGTRRPNESEDVKKYRNDNDRPITRNAFLKATTNLQRTLSHTQVEIRYPEELREFLEKPIYEGSPFLSYFQRKFIPKMVDAANGLLVWWPENIVGPDTRVTMVPIIVIPEQIKHYSMEVLTWKSEEKSEIEKDGTMQWIGEVWFIMMADGLYKRVQTKLDEFEWQDYYSNPMGGIYAMRLGGDEVSYTDNEGSYHTYLTSYFSSAVAFADECKVQFSDHQGVMVNCSSPLREVEQIDCIACQGKKKINYEVRPGVYDNRICDTCQGTGSLPLNSSPYGVLVRPKRTTGINEVNTQDIPVMRFIHPDTSILEFGGKSWKELLKMTEDALNLLFVDEAQSGIAKNIDREDKLAFLDKVAVHLYHHIIPYSIEIIHAFLFPGRTLGQISVNLPSTFVVKTETQIIEDLKSLRAESAPSYLIIEKLREFTSKQFSGDPVRMKIFDVNMLVDPYFSSTQIEKLNYLNSGAINEVDWRFSLLAPSIIANYFNTLDNPMEFSNDEIADAIIPIIQKRASEIAVRQLPDNQ